MKRNRYTVATVVWQVFLALLLFTSCTADEAYQGQGPQTPVFVWEDVSVLLEIDNGWGFTRYKNRTAVTNTEKKNQYLLTWNGDMADGAKTGAILRISKNGELTQTLKLDELSVEDIDGSYGKISFRQGEKAGTLIFSKLSEY